MGNLTLRTPTSITIPSNITSIGNEAFASCSSLTSVTFNGTIASANFGSNSTFLGDLRDKFYTSNPANGTPGTYLRTGDFYNYTWTRQ
ncbi:MAG: leucine-rich repeat domain-containing protein [Treponema sp.]|nr:leucine-rich repeat domain-containing protein [Treponema sp.]